MIPNRLSGRLETTRGVVPVLQVVWEIRDRQAVLPDLFDIIVPNVLRLSRSQKRKRSTAWRYISDRTPHASAHFRTDNPIHEGVSRVRHAPLDGLRGYDKILGPWRDLLLEQREADIHPAFLEFTINRNP